MNVIDIPNMNTEELLTVFENMVSRKSHKYWWDSDDQATYQKIKIEIKLRMNKED